MDLQLISGEFLYDDSVPKEKRWLFKYFKTTGQKRFLAYHLQFSELKQRGPYVFYRNFTDHTGVYCTIRVIQKWIKKLLILETLVAKAIERMDLITLEMIKSGRFKLLRNGKATFSLDNGSLL